MPFFVIFVIIPLMELFVFAAVGEQIGLFTTLFIALMTAIIGGALVKQQGFQTIMAMRNSMDRGKMPLDEIFDGFCLVAAGALLITPGFITDTVGFALLVPLFRKALRHYIKNHTQWAMSGTYSNHRNPHGYDPTIIEGEYERMDENDPRKDKDDTPRLD
ncbi:MAG: FxsA family protein [Alphaproteobacteria bacterium]|nr:FxsA family protein [Alphaproteobacteria bacterium]